MTIQRLTIDDQLVEAKRAQQLAANANLTGTWEPEDDPKRTGEICPGSPLKLYDDVKVRNSIFRVVAPSEGRTRFCAFGPGDFGMTLMSADLADVLDRAPADPNETPMPVTVPEPEEEPEQGGAPDEGGEPEEG